MCRRIMQPLLMYPHIIASIFTFYGLETYDYIAVTRLILGRVDNDAEITNRILQAALIYSDVASTHFARSVPANRKNMAHYLAKKVGRVCNNDNCPLLDDATAHLIITEVDDVTFRCTNKFSFRARLSPSRFTSEGGITSMSVVDWDALTYVPKLKKLKIMDEVYAPFPEGLEYLKIPYATPFPSTLKRIKITGPFPHTLWWPGANRISSSRCSGKAPKSKDDIILIPNEDLYRKLRDDPPMQNSINNIALTVGSCSIEVKSAKPGDIVPRISRDAVDFRDLSNDSIYSISICSNKEMNIYLPQNSALSNLILPEGGKIICGGNLPYLTHAAVKSAGQWNDIKNLAPNLRSLLLMYKGADVIESDSLIIIRALYNLGKFKFKCPNLRSVRNYRIAPADIEGWYYATDPDGCASKYIRVKPPKIEKPPYIRIGNTYIMYNGGEFMRQYKKFKRAGLLIS